MDFVTGLSISADWKGNSYNLILVIVDQLTKMVYYKSVKVTIDALSLVEEIINVVVYYQRIPKSIVINEGSLVISNF